MKLLLKWILSILFIIGFLYSCVYHKITHMNDEELEWITNREIGEIMYFKSPNGVIDTLTILEVDIQNNLNPINWSYFNTSCKEYIATAHIRYSFSNRNTGGLFYIKKQFNDMPICFSSVLFEGWSYDVPLKLTSLKVDNITMSDIIFFENGNPEAIKRNDSNFIISYAWSKKYGLVQYTFQDGTTFSRTDIN